MTRFAGIAVLAALIGLSGEANAQVRSATAVFRSSTTELGKAWPDIAGWVRFEQAIVADNPKSDVTVTYEITGLEPSSTHGFHVHQHGDTTITDSLESLGLHFIPLCNGDPNTDVGIGGGEGGVNDPANDECYKSSKHGDRTNENRHPGDMGNIVADADGKAAGTFTIGNEKMSLVDSSASIVGRAVVIHEGEDNLDPEQYGEAGSALAFGIIGVTSTEAANEAKAMTQPSNTYASCQFVKYSDKDTVTGLATLTRKMNNGENEIRLKGSVTGLSATEHSFHFHYYADMTQEADKLGDIYASENVKIETLQGKEGETTFDIFFKGKAAGLDDIIGRSLTIHAGPETSDPTIARAVCGTAKKGDPWENSAATSAVSYFAALATAGAAFLMAQN